MEEVTLPPETLLDEARPMPVETVPVTETEPVSGLEVALQKVPESLRKEMVERLRADFVGVIRWES